MIRLTELECTNQLAVVKIEGQLTETSFQVFGQSLVDYQRRGIEEVRFMADGLLSIDRRALDHARPHFPEQVKFSFHTSRIALQQVLAGCDLEVFFRQPG